MAGSRARPAAREMSGQSRLHLDIKSGFRESGFREWAPTGPRTSNLEASTNHSCVLIQKLESNRLLTRAICDKIKLGKSPPNARSAAAPRRWTTTRTSTSSCSCPGVRRRPRRRLHASMPPPSLTRRRAARRPMAPPPSLTPRRAGTTRARNEEEKRCGWAVSRRRPTRSSR